MTLLRKADGEPRSDRVGTIIDDLLADREEIEGSAWADCKRLWRGYMRPHRWKLIVTLLCTVIWGVVPQCFAFTNEYLLDVVLLPVDAVGEPTGRLPQLLLWFGICVVMWIVFLIANYLRFAFVMAATQAVIYQLRADMNRKLHALHIGFYDSMPAGRIVSRIVTDVDTLRKWLSRMVSNAVGLLFRIVCGLGIACWIDWRLAVVLIISLPIYSACFAVLRPRIRRANIANSRLTSRMYGLVSEKIGSVDLIKAFRREHAEDLRFTGMTHDALRLGVRLIGYMHGLEFAAAVIAAVCTGAVVWLGADLVAAGDLSIGQLIAFFGILGMLFEPVGQLTSQTVLFSAFLVSLRRVFSVLDTDIAVKPGQEQLPAGAGTIAISGLRYRYPGQERSALDGIDLQIAEGERLALMGPSGAGKTTLFQLLLRFYDPDQGSIAVAGRPLTTVDPASLRERVRLIQQEPVIFSGTIWDNITYGNAEASPEAVVAAARQAELHDFVSGLPERYRTMVGENGITLSGGQRQRLALATALITDPSVLLLDDTTSALDARTEARIRETLKQVLAGRTSIIITQRIATARDCDRIVVLDQGRIVQMGSHAQLSLEPGFYRTICEQQQIG